MNCLLFSPMRVFPPVCYFKMGLVCQKALHSVAQIHCHDYKDHMAILTVNTKKMESYYQILKWYLMSVFLTVFLTVRFLFLKSVFKYYKLGRGENSVRFHLNSSFFRNFILCMTFDSWTIICVRESNNIIYP